MDNKIKSEVFIQKLIRHVVDKYCFDFFNLATLQA